jgi:hypothetical protein
MRRPLLIFEDLGTTPRRRLFTLFGVQWLATPYAWFSPPFFCTLGIAAAFIAYADRLPASQLLAGVAYGLMLYACNTIHSLGHILGGTLLGAPMNALLLTATRDVNVYLGPRAEAPLRIRMGRAASGPLLNLLTGVVMVVAGRALHAGWLTLFGCFNLGVGLWTLCPIPTLDGWVIWRGLLGRPPSQLQ